MSVHFFFLFSLFLSLTYVRPVEIVFEVFNWMVSYLCPTHRNFGEWETGDEMMGNRNFLVQSKHQQLHSAYPPIHRLMALTVPRCSFWNKSANSPNRFACFLLLLFLLLAERPYFRTLEKVMVMPSQSASRTRAEKKTQNNIKKKKDGCWLVPDWGRTRRPFLDYLPLTHYPPSC